MPSLCYVLEVTLKLRSLSEQNISSILDGVEEAYRNHSRNGMCFLLLYYIPSDLIEALQISPLR